MGVFHEKDINNELDILTHLLELDEECKRKKVKAQFIIVGGASLLILLKEVNLSFRSTRDIDIYKISVSDKAAFHEILDDALNQKINTAVERFMIPDAEEITRLSEMTPYRHELFDNIEPYLPTNEMIVAIKAFANRQSDIDDVIESGLLDKVNPEKTIEFILEFKTFDIFADTADSHWQQFVDELKKRT